jgi:diguanylate cyclase (GGDEF)-like protein/PAS domain S-box-containing protein
MNDSTINWFTKISAKVPLRTLLIVPFVVQTVGLVSLMSYLFYRTGQEAVENLAGQLTTEVDGRIRQHLDSYLGKAQEVNHTNLDAFESGILDLNNFHALGKYFYRQVRFFNFAYINFGTKEGGFIGAGYGLGNKLDIGEIPISDLSKSRSYLVDDQGNRLKLAATIKNPQYNSAAWYLDAVKAGKPIWSSIYTWADIPDRICISASTPVYNQQKQLMGVLGIDLELSQISRFLKKLQDRRSGHIFIMERSGLMVASSEDESSTPIINGKATRLQALNSREPVIRNVTQDLIRQFGSLQAISQSQILRPSLSQNPFVKVTPYRDDYGLDWLVVTVIPESEFMAEIHANSQKTFLLCGLALLIAIGTGSITAHCITKPILRLSRASQAMSKGVWQESLSEDITIVELQALAVSFNQMATQVKKTFRESETKFSTIFHTTPDPVWIATLAEGKLLNVNESFCQFWGDSQENIVGKTCIELNVWDALDDLNYFKQQLINQRSILNFKVVVRTRYQQTRTVLMSARMECLDEQDCVIGVMRDVSDLYDELRLRKLAEDHLRKSQHFIERITYLTPNLLYIYDFMEQRNVYTNRSVAEILGYSAAEIQEMGANLFPTICHPDDLHRVYETMQQCYHLRDHEFTEIEYRIKDAQGQWRWLYSRDTVFSRTADGHVQQVLGTSQDITDRKQTELELRKSRDFREAIYNESTDAIFLVDVPNPLILDCNSRAVEMFAVASKEKLIGSEGQNLQKQRFTDDDMMMISDDIAKSGFWSREIEYVTEEGHTFWGNLAVKRINIAGKTIDLVRVTDISKRKQVELALREAEYNLRLVNQELERQVNTDGLTQIANRRCFDHCLEQEWQRLYREQQPLSLLLFDVDYFKLYNDSYGHQLGDECLIKIAQSVQEIVCRPADLVARYGGEEFAVILPNTDLPGAMAIAQRIHATIRDLAVPHQASKIGNLVTVSLGITSLIPSPELSVIDMIEQADQALYRAKEQGRNQSVIF